MSDLFRHRWFSVRSSTEWQSPVIAVALAALSIEGKGDMPPFLKTDGAAPHPTRSRG